jgi:hypothetical protein
MPKNQTRKQWRYLNSSVSPLSEPQKEKMRKERGEGKIKFKSGKKK